MNGLLQITDRRCELDVGAGADDHWLDRALRLGRFGSRWGAARRRVERPGVLERPIKVALVVDEGVRDLLVLGQIDDDVGRDALALNRTARRCVVEGGGESKRTLALQRNDGLH